MQSHILTTQDGAVLTIQINRPEKKNALTPAMYTSMAQALASSADNSSVRVALIHGHPEIFTSGNDLMDFMNTPPAGDDSPVSDFLRAIATFPKPLVAAVSGPAVGVGTTMLLHCDFVYAGENARFHMPFVNLGLCPEAASSMLLPALMGNTWAAELLLLGEPFGAVKARECRIANEVVADPLAAALATAGKLAAKPPASLRLTKMLMKQAHQERVAAAMKEEGVHFMKMLRAPEAGEAFRAFFEKREADFSKFD